MQEKVILFSILNWGLGHASRSIPLIQYLQNKGYKLIICTDGHVISFLENEVKDIIFEYLPAYDIRYKYASMAMNMILQLPKIFHAYRKEKQVFQKLIDKYNPIVCFSDNRYGCLSQDSPCYFIGHQWNILQSNKAPHPIASRVNQYLIRKFHGYLIPDNQQSPLSGILTEKINHPNAHWLGILSRFTQQAEEKTTAKSFQFLAILSGPEPARTKFEQKLINYCESKPNQQFVIVRGTEKQIDRQFPTNCFCHNIVGKTKLQKLIGDSQVIISRSGYSSVMDYISMGLKKVIFIPTPGQTEQEYLAEELTNRGYAYMKEKTMTNESLEQTWHKINLEYTTLTPISNAQETYKTVLDNLLKVLCI